MLFIIGRVEAPNTPFINIYTLTIALVIAICNISFWYKEEQYRKAVKQMDYLMFFILFILVATHS
jgi:predicted neutral ceramidase superfamily lipid hydrolase